MKAKYSLVALLLATTSLVQAEVVSPSDYSLTSISGTWAYGQTDWNDVGGAGAVNNAADVATVNGLLSDGYVPSASGGTVNGIYSAYPGFEIDVLTFAFAGGIDHVLSSLSFLSSRSYEDDTTLIFEYALNGSGWMAGASTTSGALGISTGAANWYTLFSGNITADAFRLTFVSGDQVSLHEIKLEGESSAPGVPEAGSTMGLFGLAVAGVALLRRKFVR